MRTFKEKNENGVSCSDLHGNHFVSVNIWRKKVNDVGKAVVVSLYVTSDREELIYLSLIYWCKFEIYFVCIGSKLFSPILLYNLFVQFTLHMV